jgi:ribosomal protein S18 acetylase RimI-like enzyme
MNEIFRKSGVWRKMKNREAAESEALLRDHEFWCVGASGRFLRRKNGEDKVWTLRDGAGSLSALVMQCGQTIMPVLCGLKDIPPPKFLSGFLAPVPVHSVQGLRNEAITFENALARMGRETAENIDYDLMYTNRSPNAACFASGPAGLVIRKAEFTDLEGLAVLQTGYEQEEVRPKGTETDPLVSRLNMSQILGREQVMTAELGGFLVGKINTSAVSFTRFQVGGVYVHPDFRSLGIGLRMTAVFIHSLIAQGKGVTLFVRKANPAARRIYQRLGFSFAGDYRISYY